MAPFLYWLPQGLTPATFAEERSEVFDKPPAQRTCVAGPDGQPGQVCAVDLPAKLHRYDADSQHWRQPEGRSWWLGIVRADPPGPEDLVRANTLPGHSVTLGDGKAWTVPIVYACGLFEDDMPPVVLPKTLRLTPSGLSGTVQPAYSYLQEQTAKFWQWVNAEDRSIGAVSDEEMFRLAVEALRWNYRLGVEEVNALGLIDTRSLTDIGLALIDNPTWQRVIAEAREAQEKKASAGAGITSDTDFGEMDSCAAPELLPTSNAT